MKKIGYYRCGQYEYYDIKDYDVCCTCKYFYDNKLQTRFECLKEYQNEDCYESKVED